jgi:hypothetical protein
MRSAKEPTGTGYTGLAAGLGWAWSALLAACCVLIAAYAFAFLRYRAMNLDNPFIASFALTGFAVPVHFFGAGLALLLVPVQASGWLRRRWPALHRVGGGLSAGGILIAGIGGLVMSFHAHRGWATGASFALLAVLWLSCTGLGVAAAMRRDFAAHRRWMLRGMALTCTAITLRIVLVAGVGFLRLPFDAVYISAAWGSWLFNLAAMEAWLRWPAWRAKRRARYAGSRWAYAPIDA